MKALAKQEPAVGMWMVDAPEPEPGPNDLLIRITHTSICGTDVHIYNWDAWAQRTIPVPMITGHEYVGVVEAVGSEVQGFRPGDRVSGEGHITCGHCRNCRAGRRHLCRNTMGVGVNRSGAFAERFVLPAGNAFKVPSGIPDDWAAILDPLGNAVHTALAFDVVGEDVLVTGAGPIGQMAAAVARFVGARFVVITDVNRGRLRMAEAMGAVDKAVAVPGAAAHPPAHPPAHPVADPAANAAADAAADPTLLRGVMAELGMTEGFDVVFEMSGAPAAYAQILATANHGAKLALLGIPDEPIAIDWNQVIFKGLEIRGIYGRQMFETWYKMAAMLQSGLDLAPVITHRFPVDDFQRAFDVMRSGDSGKVILDWT